LEIDVPPVVSDARPSLDVLRACFPRRSTVHIDTLLRPFTPAPPMPPCAVRSVARAAPALSEGAVAMRGRTRSEHRRAVAVAEAAIADPADSADPGPIVDGVARALPLPRARRR
jgi:hypothetical protein